MSMNVCMKFQKIFKSIIIGACLYSLGASAMGSTTLVFDTIAAEAQIAKQYRVVSDLRASASGQFSGDELYKLLAAIPANKSQIWILDLRQESHGFIDGIPVSWYKSQNTVNINKTAVRIQKEEIKLLFDLSKQKAVTVYHLNKLGGGKVLVGRPTTMIPELVETEQQLVTSHGANYKRIYVLDHNKPDDQEVDQFLKMVRKIKATDWLHFHCRGGKGRSSTFIAMYDMILNAPNFTYKQIIARQDKFGSIKLDSIPVREEKLWKVASVEERNEFMQRFYAYVVDPDGYRVRSWSAWNATN